MAGGKRTVFLFKHNVKHPWLVMAVGCVCSYLFFSHFVVETVVVEGDSMTPALHAGQVCPCGNGHTS